MSNDELVTARLRLRRWRSQDEAPMAAINRDSEVTRYLNRPVDARAVDTFLAHMLEHWDAHGFGPYAVESREAGGQRRFIGFVGLSYPTFLPELAERPELGWRLARDTWGRGLATEAALAARDHAFTRLRFRDLISIIHSHNQRSRRLAEKLGMSVERQVFNPVIDRQVDVWHLARKS